METVEIAVRRKPGCEDLPLPRYMSDGASGMDLCAAESASLAPGEARLVPTGIFIAVPPGFDAQVRPRSGLALKHAVTVANAPGTIDSDYRGEVGVILINHGREVFAVERGMRIAQLVVQPVVRARWVETDALDETVRGKGGFGHTGS